MFADASGTSQDELESKREKNGVESAGNGSSAEDGANDAVGAELQKEVEVLRAKAEENYNLYLRALADADNVRKRSSREQTNAIRYGQEGFFKDLLPVLDSFDKALAPSIAGTVLDDFTNGVLLVRKQLTEILRKNGITPIDAKGERFDPNVHQAIQRIEKHDIKEETVADEFSKGYFLHDRLLRPAIVSVWVPSAGGSELPNG